MDESWRIQLLGGLTARRGDEEISRFATSRVGSLLARLALAAGRPHGREELADLLWPDADGDAARLNLRVALASLRKQLEPPGTPPGSVLVADRTSVRLNSHACQTDAGDFEAALKAAGRAPTASGKRQALDEAVALFRGELLPGFYDEWVLEERERLNAAFEEACHRRSSLPPAPPPAAGEEKGADGETIGFPLSFTRFFGREDDCARLAQWLADPETRLLTLSGPGGAGKTRLATEVARAARASFPGPACFVPLADLSDAGGLPGAIAHALGLPRSPSAEPLDQVVAALTAQPPALLVLDNLEHLVERAAPLVLALLTRLPALTCLATSRRRLGLPGEREYPVPPLPLPDPDGTPEQIGQSASARLFVDRARAARPDFQLSRANAGDVAALCRRLEGLPLAIELVAARASALSPAAMNERLDHPFELLTSRRGDKGGRHRSLWAATAWSYDLLPPPLRRFFVGLSVFRGGCAPEDAASTCDEPQALEMLTQLRERSLAVAEDAGADLRFRLLESLREFAGEQLDPAGASDLARRHAARFLQLAEETYPLLFGPDQARWLDRLEADHENLRGALAWWLDDPEAVDESLRLSAALWRFWAVRGHYATGRERLGRALARQGGTLALRAKAANAAGNLARAQGDYGEAERLFGEALPIMRHTGHQPAVGTLLCNLGMVAMHREEYDRAISLYAESLALRREIGEEHGAAFSLQCLGMVASHQSRYGDARAFYEESLAIWSGMENAGGRMWALSGLADVALESGDNGEAARLYVETLRLSLRLGDQEALVFLLAAFARLALRAGLPVRAATLIGASEGVRARTGLQPPPKSAADLAAIRAEVRVALPESEFTPAWAAGQALPSDQAAAYALEE